MFLGSLQKCLPAFVTSKRTLNGSSIQRPTVNALDWSFLRCEISDLKSQQHSYITRPSFKEIVKHVYFSLLKAITVGFPLPAAVLSQNPIIPYLGGGKKEKKVHT